MKPTSEKLNLSQWLREMLSAGEVVTFYADYANIAPWSVIASNGDRMIEFDDRDFDCDIDGSMLLALAELAGVKIELV